jgi:hypothetical protein
LAAISLTLRSRKYFIVVGPKPGTQVRIEIFFLHKPIKLLWACAEAFLLITVDLDYHRLD